ncbi:peptidoglycan DD-metalloendopeptidase family protein, partial [bacterium]|nr:peptidoglycan DD-metalloendopeptidase family protein [bacterium]
MLENIDSFLSKHRCFIKCTTFILTGLIIFSLSNPLVFAQNKKVNQSIHKGIINSFKLNIRKSPSNESDVITVVKKGETIDILEIQGGIGGWLLVQHQGNKGYIRNRPRYIKLIKAAQKKEKQKKITAKIKAAKESVDTFTQKEVEIIEGLNEIDYSLNKARLKVMELSKDMPQLEKEIEKINKEKEQLGKAISLNRDYAGQRLKALYKMNMIGRLGSTGLPDSVFDFLVMQNSMKQIIKADFFILDKQSQDLEKFKTLEEQMHEQIQAKTDLETQLNDQIRINKKETAKKQLILKQIRQKKILSLAAVESLKSAALKLDIKIIDLQTKNRQINKKGFSFLTYKGKLNIPVKGKIISKYGPSRTGNYKAFTFQKGIDIKVERGEPVKSVFKGEVMFAQWLKGYGNLLIINHGDNYYTLYAHVEEIFKKKGERVETGDVIATAGDTGSIKGLCLHFEV